MSAIAYTIRSCSPMIFSELLEGKLKTIVFLFFFVIIYLLMFIFSFVNEHVERQSKSQH